MTKECLAKKAKRSFLARNWCFGAIGAAIIMVFTGSLTKMTPLAVAGVVLMFLGWFSASILHTRGSDLRTKLYHAYYERKRELDEVVEHLTALYTYGLQKCPYTDDDIAAIRGLMGAIDAKFPHSRWARTIPNTQHQVKEITAYLAEGYFGERRAWQQDKKTLDRVWENA